MSPTTGGIVVGSIQTTNRLLVLVPVVASGVKMSNRPRIPVTERVYLNSGTLEDINKLFVDFAEQHSIDISTITLDVDAYDNVPELYLSSTREMTDEEIKADEERKAAQQETRKENARRTIEGWRDEFPELFPPTIAERP